MPVHEHPDTHFLIDAHPEHPASADREPLLGHGFEFAPAIAEALADLAPGEPPQLDLGAFRLARFGRDRLAPTPSLRRRRARRRAPGYRA